MCAAAVHQDFTLAVSRTWEFHPIAFCLGYREAEAAVEAGDMTEKHLAMRHHQWIQSMKRSGKGETESPDVVKVMTCSGMNAAMCSKFVYLGSMLTPDATAQGEIRRRAAIVWSDSLWRP